MRILFIFLILLQGCSYSSYTTVKMTGKTLKVPILRGLIPIEGEDVEATLTREMHINREVKSADKTD